MIPRLHQRTDAMRSVSKERFLSRQIRLMEICRIIQEIVSLLASIVAEAGAMSPCAEARMAGSSYKILNIQLTNN